MEGRTECPAARNGGAWRSTSKPRPLSGCVSTKIRHGGKGVGRSPSIRHKISANRGNGNRDRRNLESDVAAMTHDLGADLDEL